MLIDDRMYVGKLFGKKVTLMTTTNPLHIYCKNCGAPAGYDITHQTYACPNCGQTSGVEEVTDNLLHWRKLHKHDMEVQHVPPMDYVECSGCGAHVAFKEGEASSTCDFCGGHLVRHEFAEQKDMPEIVIPFVLTKKEAREQLQKWADANKGKKEANIIQSNLKNMEGYYLPYRLVRGPVHGTAKRDQLGYKTYQCGGFIEGTAVNTSMQLDNDVLDAAEPFDWSAVRPFEYGYIGGLPVKFNDMSDANISRRVIDEVEHAYRPDISKALHSDDVEIKINTGDLLNVSALMPMYVLKVGKKFNAVVNGQTGRVAVSSTEQPKGPSKLWMVEPIMLWLILMAGAFWYWPDAYFLSIYGTIFALLLYAMYDNVQNGIILKQTHQGEATRAYRSDGVLHMEKGENVLQNAFPNTPVFFEKVDGKDVPVEVAFTSADRIIMILINGIGISFLPAIIAAVLAMIGVGNKSVIDLNYRYGAAWYVLAFFMMLLYLVRGIRQGIFSHPILTMVLPDGTRKRLKDNANKGVGFFAMFRDANGNASLNDIRKELGGMFYAMVGFVLFLILGCVGAIMD